MTGKWFGAGLTVLMLLIFVTVVLLACESIWFRKTGTEFSPYSFNTREFEIGGVLNRTVIQPASLCCSTEISKHLTTSTQTVGNSRWDVVRYTVGWNDHVRNEASILVDALNLIDRDANFVWERWSKKHPKHAAILWPAIQQLAIHHAYFAIPELLEIAATRPSLPDLQSAVGKTSLQAGIDQAARMVARGEWTEAERTLDWASSFGTTEELKELLGRLPSASSTAFESTSR